MATNQGKTGQKKTGQRAMAKTGQRQPTASGSGAPPQLNGRHMATLNSALKQIHGGLTKLAGIPGLDLPWLQQGDAQTGAGQQRQAA